MSDHLFDVVILGGGSGGYAAALRARQLGRTVALVESDLLGGTCLHRGCIPTKAMLHVAEIADSVREGRSVGVLGDYHGIEPAGMQAYKKKVVSRLYGGLQGLVDRSGVVLVPGHGVVVDATAVRVGDSLYRGQQLIIATGSSPTRPAFLPEDAGVITSDEALDLERLPQSVIVLGGGVIGCEFASAWASMGISVTMVEAAGSLVPEADSEVSRRLERGLKRRKVRIKTGHAVTSCERRGDVLAIAVGDGSTVAAEMVLVAVGRTPRTAGIGLEEIGVDVSDSGHIKVDELGRTNVDGVWAVGDIIATYQLAHAGFAEGILAAEAGAGLEVQPIAYDAMPRIVYSHPEVVAVGLTEEEALTTAPGRVRSFTYDLAGNGKTQILGGQGMAKVILVDERTVGVHLVGPRVSELAAQAQTIIASGTPSAAVAANVHPHPTQSEALGEAYLALQGKALHVH